MRRLWIISVFFIMLSCADDKEPLEGSWSINDSNEVFHVYTFDDWTGFMLESGKKNRLGELVYTSDSTAKMTFWKGGEVELKYIIPEEGTCVTSIGEHTFLMLQILGADGYKTDDDEKAIRAAIYAAKP